jgi:hypothetical protein
LRALDEDARILVCWATRRSACEPPATTAWYHSPNPSIIWAHTTIDALDRFSRAGYR